MKATKHIAAIALGMTLLGGCELERVSFTEIYPENFFRNENDMNSALTGLYQPFKTSWGKFYCADQWSYFVISDFTSGTMDSKWANEGYYHFFEHWWRENGTDLGTQFAEKMYANYNQLTTIQNTIRSIENSTVSETLKTVAIAEAKCLYGWIGFIMYDLFGPVPLITGEGMDNPTEKVLIPRLTDEQYTAVMLQNLDDAIMSLPEKQDEWGRVTKGMAMILKLKFHMANRDFSEGEKVARELVELEEKGVYELLPVYADVFDKAQARNREIIHAIPCGAGNPNYWLTQVMHSDVAGYDGSAWGTFNMQWDFYDTFEPFDDRTKRILTSYESKSGSIVNRGSGNLTRGALPRKLGEDPAQTGSVGTTDHIVYRYADVLLSLAECINENKNGPDAEAVALVNRIRTRANLPNLEAQHTANKTAFNNAILSERLHEFFCEGLSRQDQIRHGVFISNSEQRFPDSQTDWYKTRFPIPRKYINESQGVVEQNPGY